MSWVKDILYKQIESGCEAVTHENYLERKEICEACPFHGQVKLPAPFSHLTDTGCTICGCPTKTKARLKRANAFLDKPYLGSEDFICTHPDGNKWESCDKKHE